MGFRKRRIVFDPASEKGRRSDDDPLGIDR
jgi:hypothetical protein